MSDVHFVQPAGYGPGGEAMFNNPGQHVIFTMEKFIQPYQSNIEGKPIFKEIEMVEYVTADTLTVPKFKVTDYERQAFRTQYEAFKNQRAQVPDGTLMSFLYPGAPEIVEMLASLKIYTVEKLAALSDLEIQQIPMGGFEMRHKAQKFMETSKDSAKFHKLEMEREADRVKMQEQQELLDRMSARMRALEAKEELALGLHDDVGPAAPKRRGRPPRVQVEDAGEEASA